MFYLKSKHQILSSIRSTVVNWNLSCLCFSEIYKWSSVYDSNATI